MFYLATGLLVLMAAPEDAKKAELAKLAGNWKVTSLEIGGREVLQDSSPLIKVVFQDDRMKFPGNSKGQGASEFSLRIDPSTNPKIMDIKAESGNNMGDEFEGIFEVTGDKVQICIRAPAGTKDRPLEFASKVDTGLILLKLERLKE